MWPPVDRSAMTTSTHKGLQALQGDTNTRVSHKVSVYSKT